MGGLFVCSAVVEPRFSYVLGQHLCHWATCPAVHLILMDSSEVCVLGFIFPCCYFFGDFCGFFFLLSPLQYLPVFLLNPLHWPSYFTCFLFRYLCLWIPIPISECWGVFLLLSPLPILLSGVDFLYCGREISQISLSLSLTTFKCTGLLSIAAVKVQSSKTHSFCTAEPVCLMLA